MENGLFLWIHHRRVDICSKVISGIRRNKSRLEKLLLLLLRHGPNCSRRAPDYTTLMMTRYAIVARLHLHKIDGVILTPKLRT